MYTQYEDSEVMFTSNKYRAQTEIIDLVAIIHPSNR